MFLKIAPFAESYDFWIALFFCQIAPFIWLFIAYLQSRGGSWIIKRNHLGQEIGRTEGGNIPIQKSAWFLFFLLHFLLGAVMFWGLIWPDHHDVWFI